jgi:hypothetical protein
MKDLHLRRSFGSVEMRLLSKPFIGRETGVVGSGATLTDTASVGA